MVINGMAVVEVVVVVGADVGGSEVGEAVVEGVCTVKSTSFTNSGSAVLLMQRLSS